MVEPLQPGHNRRGPADRETLAFFTGAYLKQQAVVKREQKELARIRNRAASAGIKTGPFMEMLKIRDEDSDLVFERMHTLKEYCKMMDVPIGRQLNLFDSLEMQLPEDKPETERAYDSGYLLGLLGVDPENSENKQHMAGWNKGFVENAARVMELDKPDPSSGRAKRGKVLPITPKRARRA